MRGETPPDGARIGLDRRAVRRWHAEILERDALAVEHAEDIVIRHDEELRRVGKRLVQRIPGRIGVAVRRDDRQVAHLAIEAARHGAGRRIGGEEAVFVKQHGDLGRKAAI